MDLSILPFFDFFLVTEVEAFALLAINIDEFPA